VVFHRLTEGGLWFLSARTIAAKESCGLKTTLRTRED